MGCAAGVVFAMAEILADYLLGASALRPVRMFASVVEGGYAVDGMGIASATILGLLVHFALSAGFGVLFACLRGVVPPARRTWSFSVASGLLYGLALWVLDFQIIGRALYPWVLEMNQVVQAFLHAAFFGLPLSLLLEAAEPHPRLPFSSPAR